MSEISSVVLARYRKVCSMARAAGGNENEKEVARKLAKTMERKHPGLKAAASREDRYDELYDKVKRESGMPSAADVVPPSGGGVIDMMRRATERVLGKDPIKWAVEHAERQMENFVREMAESGVDLDLNQSWEDAYMSLLEQLEAHCHIDFTDAEGPNGESLLVLEVELPPALFSRIGADPNGPQIFYKFIKDAEAASREVVPPSAG